MKDKLVDYWETENRLYDTYPNYCHYSTQLVFNKYFRDIKRKKILDIGCGHGAMMNFFKKKGAIVKGVDLSPEAVSYSRSIGLDVIQADCRKLPLPNNSFDIVFSLGVVEHFDETIQAIKEHLRVCKSDGKAVIIVPHYNSLSYFGAVLWKHIRWGLKYDMMTAIGKAYTKNRFRKILIKAGCKNIKILTYFGSAPFKVLTGKLNKRLAYSIENSWYGKNFGHLLLGISTK